MLDGPFDVTATCQELQRVVNVACRRVRPEATVRRWYIVESNAVRARHFIRQLRPRIVGAGRRHQVLIRNEAVGTSKILERANLEHALRLAFQPLEEELFFGAELTPERVRVASSGFANGNTNGTTAIAPISQGVRGGRDKIQFLRVDMDPLLSQFRRPLVLRYSDTVTTNGVTKTQRVEKQILRPDIIFTATDLGTWPAPFQPIPWIYGRGKEYISLSDINGLVIAPNESQGPGLVDFNGGGLISFNRSGPGRINLGSGTTEQDSTTTFVWGSFDGSTNAPIVYPAGRVTLRDLERVALSGN